MSDKEEMGVYCYGPGCMKNASERFKVTGIITGNQPQIVALCPKCEEDLRNGQNKVERIVGRKK